MVVYSHLALMSLALMHKVSTGCFVVKEVFCFLLLDDKPLTHLESHVSHYLLVMLICSVLLPSVL